MAAAISLTFFPHTMKGRALLSFIIKLSQVERQFSYMPSPCWTLCSVTCSPDLFSKETNFRIWACMIQTDCNVYPVWFFRDSLDSLEPCAISEELWDCIAILLRLVIWHSHRKMLWKMDACCIFQMPSHPAIPIHKVSERGLDMGLWHFVKVCGTLRLTDPALGCGRPHGELRI